MMPRYPLDAYELAVVQFELAVSQKLGRDAVLSVPFVPGDGTAKVRARLIEEEAAELVRALMNEDLAAIAKESADVKYVVYGTDTAYGIPAWSVFEAVHANNMLKMDGSRFDGQKLIKPRNHPKTDLSAILAGVGR